MNDNTRARLAHAATIAGTILFAISLTMSALAQAPGWEWTWSLTAIITGSTLAATHLDWWLACTRTGRAFAQALGGNPRNPRACSGHAAIRGDMTGMPCDPDAETTGLEER